MNNGGKLFPGHRASGGLSQDVQTLSVSLSMKESVAFLPEGSLSPVQVRAKHPGGPYLIRVPDKQVIQSKPSSRLEKDQQLLAAQGVADYPFLSQNGEGESCIPLANGRCRASLIGLQESANVPVSTRIWWMSVPGSAGYS